MKQRRDSGGRASEVRGLILVRLLVMTVLGLLLWGADRTGSLAVSPGPPLVVLSAIWLLTFLYWTGLRFGIPLAGLVGGQIVLDLVIGTILVAGTGGNSSPLVVLYLLTIFIAGMFLHRRGAVLTALGAFVAFAGVIASSGGEEAGLSTAHAWYQIGIHGSAFLLLAVLSGVLADRTRTSRERLESAEEELERVVSFTDRVLENMPIGVVTAGPDGEILGSNRAARDILGLPAETRIAGSDLGYFLESVSAGLGDALESVLVTRKWASREEVLLRDGTRERPIGISITPLTDEEQGLDGVIVTFTDLEEIRRMERQMRRAEQLANLGELAAGVAHEIRNPLASISGAVQFLREESEPADDEAEMMDLIVKESDRLNRIIDGVLDYTRDHSSSRDRHDISITAREVVRLVHHDRALNLGKTILLEFPDDQDFRAEVEEGGMKQVFFNLARNAMEAMGVGGILRITGENTGDGWIHVAFRDSGVGIEPHEMEHIFKPFHTSKQGGTGMGLSIASRIVEGNGGRIRAKSTPGMGTALIVELPTSPAGGGSTPEGSQPKEEEAPVDDSTLRAS